MASYAHYLQPREPRIVGLTFFVLAAVAALAVAGLVAIGMRVAPGPILPIASLPAVLLGVGAFYLVGGRSDRIGHTLIAIAQVIWFGSVGGIASYMLIRMGRPLSTPGWCAPIWLSASIGRLIAASSITLVP